MKTRKARSATIILIILWLLSGLSNISIAENIPISEEGLGRIGLNKIRLESGIGVLVFNLTTSTDRLTGDGYLTVSNTYNSSVTIYCQVISKLSSVDLDEERNPRLHKVISDFIIFNPIPDISWITLEDTEAIIDPFSIYNFRYEVDIPLDEEDSFEASRGYLLYIHIRKDLGDVTGAVIGIDYNYKLFLVFTGVIEQEQNIALGLFLLLFMPSWVVLGIGFVLYKRKHKKIDIIPDTSPVYTNKDNTEIISEDKSVLDKDSMHQRVDDLLRRKDG